MSAVHAEGSFTLNDHCDWGDLIQWPPKEPEPVYETPRILEHWGLECEFSDDGEEWFTETLRGYFPNIKYRWVTDAGSRWQYCRIARIPEQAQTLPPNYMLEALRFALNTLEKGIQVRIQDQWPALKAILPETIQKVKDAIERAEADLGAQKQPSSVAKIQAETKAVARELENVGGCCQVPTKQHPADREPTDEEAERACELRFNGEDGEKHWDDFQREAKRAFMKSAKWWLKAWQQVWREAK